MIARTWHGIATAAKAGKYRGHFTSTVASRLRQIKGFHGAHLLQREENGQVIGGSLAWSGSFQFAFEIDPKNRLRALSGINPFGSQYHLMPEQLFTTPAMLWTWSVIAASQPEKSCATRAPGSPTSALSGRYVNGAIRTNTDGDSGT